MLDSWRSFLREGRRKPKGGILTKNLKVMFIAALLMFLVPGTAASSGLFGPPQPLSREEGGLNTSIGYGYHEDKFENGNEHIIRQNQIYTQATYGGARRLWEVYGRIGIADLEIDDAFRSGSASTTSSRHDFEDNDEFFGTLGAKVFYPLRGTFGIGAFIQGSYFFSDFEDRASGIQNGVPYSTELSVENFWDVYSGIGLQATVPHGVILYAGPYVYYSEAKASPSRNIPGLQLAAGDDTLQNKTAVGGFAGMQVPLGKGFSLNVEGQYSERFSAGIAVTYTYQNRRQ